MTPRTARRARPVLVSLSAVAMAAATALPAAAAPNEVVYDALGDSYAAGFGTAPVTPPCAQSPMAYPYVLDGRMKIDLDDFAACSGAVAALGGNSIHAQLGALSEDTDLVTISIGGNDIGWTETIVLCLLNGAPTCDGAVGHSESLITGVLPGLLDAAYLEVRAAAPNAHVVVTGYPRLFSPESGDYAGTTVIDLGGRPITLPFLVSVEEQQMLNDGADLLNGAIATVASDHGFQFVDVTSRFTGHGVNADDAWIGGVNDPEVFHPTIQGQKAYGSALTSQINPRSLR